MGLAVYDGQYDLLGYQGDGLLWTNLDLESILGSQGSPQANESVGKLKIIEIPGQNPAFLMLPFPGRAIFSEQVYFHRRIVSTSMGCDQFMEGGYAFVTDQHKRILFELGTGLIRRKAFQTIGVSEALNGKRIYHIEFGEMNTSSPTMPTGNHGHRGALHIVASPFPDRICPVAIDPCPGTLALWFGTSRIVQPLRSLKEGHLH
jgi:hypothetical protein